MWSRKFGGKKAEGEDAMPLLAIGFSSKQDGKEHGEYLREEEERVVC